MIDLLLYNQIDILPLATYGLLVLIWLISLPSYLYHTYYIEEDESITAEQFKKQHQIKPEIPRYEQVAEDVFEVGLSVENKQTK